MTTENDDIEHSDSDITSETDPSQNITPHYEHIPLQKTLETIIENNFENIIPDIKKTEKLLSEGKTIIYRYVTFEEFAYLCEKGSISAEIIGKTLNKDNKEVDSEINESVLFGYSPFCYLTPQHSMLRLEIDVSSSKKGSGKASYTYKDKYSDDAKAFTQDFPEIYFKSYTLDNVVSIGFDDAPYPEADWYIEKLINTSFIDFYIPAFFKESLLPGPKRDSAILKNEEEKKVIIKKYASMSYEEFMASPETGINMPEIENLRSKRDTVLTNNPNSYKTALFILLRIYTKKYMSESKE